ncbi:MAG: sodium/proton-translocating pyrophosphatase [Rickettsiales bacterium]|jgi:K(+)-stimulated pyrophosphate-energized sodium pump|nr:sodium/proton-translocating pyrophosphatase [Rickettsiales bacterium]
MLSEFFVFVEKFFADLFLFNVYAIGCVVGGLIFLLTSVMYFYLRIKKIKEDKISGLSYAIKIGVETFLKKWNRIFLFVSIFIGCGIYEIFGAMTLFSFALGIFISYVAILIGLKSAHKGGGRTVIAAKSGAGEAFSITFISGAISGLAFSSLSLMGISFLMYFIDGNLDVMNNIIGFAIGIALTTLFIRTIGSVYAKSADISSYLLQCKSVSGKGLKHNNANLNLSYVADNVGDNINNIAGLGMDIMDANISAIIAGIVLATILPIVDISRYISTDVSREALISLPVIISMLGLLASFVGIISRVFITNEKPKKILDIIGMIVLLVFFGLAFSAIYFLNYPIKLFVPIFCGGLSGFLISKLADMYSTGSCINYILKYSKRGPAGNIIAGLSRGFSSVIIPVVLLIATMFISYKFAGLYGLSLASIGLICTFAFVLTVGSAGPVCDNAHSISVMSGMKESVNRITADLDILGNTSAVTTKALSISASILTALALFVAYKQEVEFYSMSRIFMDVTSIDILIGLFIGVVIVMVSASYIIRSVDKMIDMMIEFFANHNYKVEEVSAQKFKYTRNFVRNFFVRRREYSAKMESLCVQTYGFKINDIKIFLKSFINKSVKNLLFPVLFIVAIPVGVFLMGIEFVAGVMIGSFLFGSCFAFLMYNAGGFWDNAKKANYIQNLNGKSDENIKDSVLAGDIVGDYFKDAIGPFINIIVKLISIVALLIAPLMLR